jgi:hypothetical protein
MDKIWALVAESCPARLFQAGGAKAPLEEQTDLLMPRARLQEQDLVSIEVNKESVGFDVDAFVEHLPGVSNRARCRSLGACPGQPV